MLTCRGINSSIPGLASSVKDLLTDRLPELLKRQRLAIHHRTATASASPGSLGPFFRAVYKQLSSETLPILAKAYCHYRAF
jgi:hypothetical protein